MLASMNDSASIMSPLFANSSCDPFSSRATACSMGNYVRYAVLVRSAADVAATIAFAAKHNIRFVIRNTGHDYLGRSTGAGALSVWTHALKGVNFTEWDDEFYKGKAARLGAGVQGFDIMAATHGKGLVVVGGECPTVGPAGGYTQGGGHSALSSSFGLSADNTLEWEVVLANGSHVFASRTRNSDLYWALSGGGGGNYAVVLGLTVRAHPDAPVGGASVIFERANNPERFWRGVDAFHTALPGIIDAGVMAVYDITAEAFLLAPATAYNKSGVEVRALMQPFLTELDRMNMTYYASFSQWPTYYEHYNQYFGPLPLGSIRLGVASDSGRVGGRLVPRRTVAGNTTALGLAARRVTGLGATWVGVATDVSRFGGKGQNAVLPAWRETLVHVILTTPLRAGQRPDDAEDTMTQRIMPAMVDVTPGSGSYMNEADFRQPGWQGAFFGSNYERLLEVKRRYDPEGFFYATAAVGSEAWTVKGDGRMCRASGG
jgi:FAD/FMN-containing dehydrogenase